MKKIKETEFYAELEKNHNAVYKVEVGKKTCSTSPLPTCGCDACQQLIGAYNEDIIFFEKFGAMQKWAFEITN